MAADRRPTTVAALVAAVAMLGIAPAMTVAAASPSPRLEATTGTSHSDASCGDGAGAVRVTGRYSTTGKATKAWFQYGTDFRGDHILHPKRTRKIRVRSINNISACITDVPAEDFLVYRLVISDQGKVARGKIKQDGGHGA